jgi:N6-L-threonylcarbamoyladenine synthase
MAKGLALGSGLPLVGINHLEAHLYSAWLQPNAKHNDEKEESNDEMKFPLVALIVSGGHTELILMTDHLTYQRLGGTLDDAAGEAFDKVGRLLGLPYPGGPSIQKAAESGNPTAFAFPRAWLEDSWNFSFSGLKTAVLREVQRLKSFQYNIPVSDLAASFQSAVVDVLVGKTIKAAKEFNAKRIVLAGGVSANLPLRDGMVNQAHCPVSIPPLNLCTDNAAMVASAGYYRFVNGYQDALDLDVQPNWQLTDMRISREL